MSRQENHDAIALVKRYRPEGDRTPPRRPSPGDETEALTRYRRLLPAMGVSRENRWSSPTEIRKGDARQGISSSQPGRTASRRPGRSWPPAVHASRPPDESWP